MLDYETMVRVQGSTDGQAGYSRAWPEGWVMANEQSVVCRVELSA